MSPQEAAVRVVKMTCVTIITLGTIRAITHIVK